MKKYVGEAVGTLVLTLVVALALVGTFVVPVPVLAALTLGLFVYSLGHLSGAHINPAVTVGAWSIGKVTTDDLIKYIIAQCIGAGAALLIVQSMVSETADLIVTSGLEVGLAELIGTAIFTFGIASVVFGKTPAVMSGMVIGGSLLLGIATAALLGSNGVLNPAVALGIGSFNIMYVLGPILGSVLGMQVYKRLAL
ncbi:MAG: aquaporin [Candidatus Pacebacteria bacterium]|jgi:aquaporin Z|nr:aquaporin [Candidatus Paceibacterota bacterium]